MITKRFAIQIILSLLLGSIAVLSYSPFDIWPIAFISFSGLLCLISNKTTKQAAVIGFTWGIGYFLSGVHWVYVSIKQYGELPTPVAMIILALLIAYLSIYPMLFSLLLRFFNRHIDAFSFKQLVILSPILWQCTEYVRGHFLNGFAWLQLGYTQLESPLSGLFPLIGITGVNVIFSMICGLFIYIIHQIYQRNRQASNISKKYFFGALSALLILFFAPLLVKNAQWTLSDTTRDANITLIQGNIAQSIRWNRHQLENTLNQYSELTQKHIQQSDIIIWPEAAITDIEINQQHYLKLLDDLAIKNDTSIAVGIINLNQRQNSYDLYNTLIVLGDTSPYQYPTENRYNKYHLVPFGEYTPFEQLLKPIAQLLNIPMSSMSAGAAIQQPISMKGFKFTTAICYEIILSDLVWQNFTTDTDFILTISNDAWFGDTIGPWQHLQMARTRALEFGRTVIRSTNNGISVIINANGKVVKQIPQFQQEVLSANLSPNTGLTPYAKYGDYPIYALLAIMFVSLFVRQKW